MSKSFLITSHTEGYFPFEQRSILHELVKSLKKFFPDCFIVIASQSQVEFETQTLVDYVVIDKTTVNQPHGAGEIALLSMGIAALERFERKDCFKLVYDFVIDETNYQLFDQWQNLDKDFVGCYWRTTGLGIGSWIWYGTLEIQKQILDFDYLDKLLEWKILEMIQTKNLLDRCYIYEDNVSMFNGNWFEKCDLVHSGGTVLKYKYGTVGSAVRLTDQNSSLIPLIIQSLIYQSKLPNHLILIDDRSNKIDLRFEQHYQLLFEMLAKNNISWHLIYYFNEMHIISHLSELNIDWYWLVSTDSIPDRDYLKYNYRRIILNHNIGICIDQEKNIFYRNKIIQIQNNIENLNDFLVDEMSKTQYNIISNHRS